MELSSRVEYALLALMELSDRQKQGKPLKATEIAQIQRIPERYLDQILIVLRRSGLIQSQRGVKGGYLLTKKPSQITLWDVVALLEGEGDRQPEEETMNPTVEKKVVISFWKQVSQEYQAILASYTLEDFCKQRSAYQQEKVMYYI
jgi:Rrf2 family protein